MTAVGKQWPDAVLYVRLPPALKRAVVKQAREQRVSANKLANDALAAGLKLTAFAISADMDVSDAVAQ